MIIIEEGRLQFQFPSDWHVCKYDGINHFYYNQVRRCEGSKAVDILAWSGKELFMIEAKDFRGDRIKNKERILKGELVSEVTQKVRDTIAGLYGAFRSFNEELQPFYRPLVSEKRQSVKIVLLLEEDRPPERAKSFKYRRSQLQKVLNSHLKFLSVHCYVHNCSDLPKHFQWNVK
jgi:Holliday junction resolvase